MTEFEQKIKITNCMAEWGNRVSSCDFGDVKYIVWDNSALVPQIKGETLETTYEFFDEHGKHMFTLSESKYGLRFFDKVKRMFIELL